jgi:hypothetical protein
VTATLSPPVRVFAVVAALIAAGLAAFALVAGRGNSDATETPAPSASTAHTAPQATTPTRVQPKPPTVPHRAAVAKSGLPIPIDHALRYRRFVVVAVYIPGAPVDAVVRREARAAAIQTHAGFVSISALGERAAGMLVAKTGVLPDPAVVVVKRPGVVVATLSVTDRETIAQVISQARR